MGILSSGLYSRSDVFAAVSRLHVLDSTRPLQCTNIRRCSLLLAMARMPKPSIVWYKGAEYLWVLLSGVILFQVH